MLISNPRGNYRFVPGIAPFSSAVIADPGFEIIHARMRELTPLDPGFALVDQCLQAASRPRTALCGVHLRLPKPLTSQGFDEFNRPYIEGLRAWGLEVEGANPVARTNVALEVDPPERPCLAGFFYTVPASHAAPTFVVSGTPEVQARSAAGRQIVAAGDVSPAGMRLKAQCVLEVLEKRLSELEMNWGTVTSINLYTTADIHPLLPTLLLPSMGKAGRAGITWFYARPPVQGLDLEIDLFTVRQQLMVG
ncbi:MAG TPA: hypothetical protein VKV28_15145 [Candidatus Binataceae bacterium]|nr:hypothetical protein [Candidatus Binataceae bacterium]